MIFLYINYFVLGAAEQLLDRCKTMFVSDGTNGIQEDLTPETRQQITIQQEALCDLGERVLALCYMIIPNDSYSIHSLPIS